MRLSIILVHYHTPVLAERAVEALRKDPEAAEIFGENRAEILIVDNGSDAAGRSLLGRLPARVLGTGENLGYAGGLNLGVSEAKGDRLIAMNPDVLAEPGCVPRLLEALDAGAAVAGPRFFLEATMRMMIPPVEARDRRSELLARLAERGGSWAKFARGRWRRHARRHWRASEPIDSHSLSGAMLAIRRSAWDSAGPFDPAYRLYFEEDDWLWRVRRLGLSGRYVPQARAVHLYNQSAGSESKAGEWFDESRRRFESRHYGEWFSRLLPVAGAKTPDRRDAGGLPGAEAVERVPPKLDLTAFESRSPGPLWIELSPNARGYPGAAERLQTAGGESWELPAGLRRGLAPGSYSLRVVDAEGRELSTSRWRQGPQRADTGTAESGAGR